MARRSGRRAGWQPIVGRLMREAGLGSARVALALGKGPAPSLCSRGWMPAERAGGWAGGESCCWEQWRIKNICSSCVPPCLLFLTSLSKANKELAVRFLAGTLSCWSWRGISLSAPLACSPPIPPRHVAAPGWFQVRLLLSPGWGGWWECTWLLLPPCPEKCYVKYLSVKSSI